jgi:hypothetical protein
VLKYNEKEQIEICNTLTLHEVFGVNAFVEKRKELVEEVFEIFWFNGLEERVPDLGIKIPSGFRG